MRLNLYKPTLWQQYNPIWKNKEKEREYVNGRILPLRTSTSLFYNLLLTITNIIRYINDGDEWLIGENKGKDYKDPQDK